MKPGLLLTLALAATQPAAVDLHADPLPRGAVARLGTTRFRAPADIHGLAFSADGKQLAAATATGLQVWHAATGKPHWSAGTSTYQEGLAVVGDGRFIVTRARDKPIAVWDTQTGEVVRELAFPQWWHTSLEGAVRGSAFALQTRVGEVYLADAAKNDAPRLLIKVPERQPAPLAWSRDGTLLAIGSMKHVSVWHAATHQQLHQFHVPGWMFLLAFGANDRTLAVVTDTQVLLFDMVTGKALKELTPYSSNPFALWFSDDGKRLAVAGRDGTTRVRVWDTATGKVVHVFECEGEPRVAAFSPDGTTIALSYWPNRVGLWQVAPGAAAGQADGHGAMVRHIAYLPGRAEVATVTADGEARVWDAAGRPVRAFNQTRSDLYGARPCFAVQAKVLVNVEGDHTLGFWNMATGELRRWEVPMQEDFVLFDVSPRGETVVLWTRSAVLVWAVGADRPRLRCPCQQFAWQAMLSPDGQALVIRDEPVIQLWDLAAGCPAWTVRADLGWSLKGFTPDGRAVLVCPAHDELTWLDARNGTPLKSVSVAPPMVGRAVFSGDGRWMATAHRGGVIQLWETRSHLRLWTFTASAQLAADTRQVDGLAFAPDGRHLAVAVEDTSVLIYDPDALVPDVAERVRELTPAKRKGSWAALAGNNGEDAFRAAAVLAATPDETVADLRTRLTPVPVVSDKRLEQLVDDLDAKTFARREAASKALAGLGDIAEPPLRELLKTNPTLEVRRRAELLLEALDRRYTQFPSKALFDDRALDVLERIGTAEARTLLEKLARGDPRARQTRQAREALRRLAEGGG
jgi:WD40 repeat protein